MTKMKEAMTAVRVFLTLLRLPQLLVGCRGWGAGVGFLQMYIISSLFEMAGNAVSTPSGWSGIK